MMAVDLLSRMIELEHQFPNEELRLAIEELRPIYPIVPGSEDKLKSVFSHLRLARDSAEETIKLELEVMTLILESRGIHWAGGEQRRR
jgi:hypothetical protein